MSRRYYVETLPDGTQQFVSLKRSKSYHHHRHKWHGDYYKGNRDEWRALFERNRALEAANQAFSDQNNALRASISAYEGEIHHLGQVVVPQLQDQIAALQAENHNLRCALGNPHVPSSPHGHKDLEKLRQQICKLEKENREILEENADLHYRLRELSKQLDQNCNRRVSDSCKEVEYWKGHCHHWERKFKELREQHVKIVAIVDDRTERLAVYEEFFKRRRFV